MANDIRTIRRHDPGYPARLKTIYDPPPVLSVLGQLVPEDDMALAIVGSRYPTPYGLDMAERFAAELASCGMTIVSGMARGIDSAAHRGALRTGGRTIAVLGSGLRRIYPAEHEQLAEEIAASGAVLSEFPLDEPPRPAYFPQRNRLISGLSLGVLVVEAGERSGALITASCAAEQGREVFAIPGKITSPASVGTHALLQDGAKLVTCLNDIVEELRLTRMPRAPAGNATAPQAPPLPADEQRLLQHLSDEPLYIDDLAALADLSSPELSSLLLALEFKHLVRQWPGQRYTRKGSDP